MRDRGEEQSGKRAAQMIAAQDAAIDRARDARRAISAVFEEMRTQVTQASAKHWRRNGDQRRLAAGAATAVHEQWRSPSPWPGGWTETLEFRASTRSEPVAKIEVELQPTGQVHGANLLISELGEETVEGHPRLDELKELMGSTNHAEALLRRTLEQIDTDVERHAWHTHQTMCELGRGKEIILWAPESIDGEDARKAVARIQNEALWYRDEAPNTDDRIEQSFESTKPRPIKLEGKEWVVIDATRTTSPPEGTGAAIREQLVRLRAREAEQAKERARDDSAT